MFRLRCVSGVLACGVLLAMTGLAQAQPPVAKPQPPPAGTAQAPAPAKPVAPATGAPLQQPARTRPAAPATTAPAQAPAPPVPKIQPATDGATEGPPTEAQLGVRLYPGATFLGSYDAGRGQRFYLFGVQQTFSSTVTFYKTDLGKGELVFEAPPIHMFDVGKFREETMAFPPSVAIKDYTWGGAPGYPNPKPGAAPPMFPTVIQIVPQPTPAAGPIR